MDTSFFGIGLPELIFIAIIALIVLGPERLPATMREIAKMWGYVRNLTRELTSQFGDELKALDDINPQKLMREMIDSAEEEARKTMSVANTVAATKVTSTVTTTATVSSVVTPDGTTSTVDSVTTEAKSASTPVEENRILPADATPAVQPETPENQAPAQPNGGSVANTNADNKTEDAG